MAVSEFYTLDDLSARRTKMAKWICDRLKKFVNYYHYGQTIDRKCIMHQQYMIALLEAVECYTPITATTQDGVNNCLTETKLDAIFKSVESITGLCFLTKGTTYDPNTDVGIAKIQITLNTGSSLEDNSGNNSETNTDQLGNTPVDTSVNVSG